MNCVLTTAALVTTYGQISKVIGQEWSKLNEKDKEPYLQQQAKLKEEVRWREYFFLCLFHMQPFRSYATFVLHATVHEG